MDTKTQKTIYQSINFDLILFNGAPGTGKSSVCDFLGEKLESPSIDFGKLREFHLDKKWLRKSDAEEGMTYEILENMLTVYLSHGLNNILINDLKEWRTAKLRKKFSNYSIIVVTLYTQSYDVLKQRINDRAKGWRDVDLAWEINNRILSREIWDNEIRVDISAIGIDSSIHSVLNSLYSQVGEKK